jgi:hypothetical protein
MEPVETKPGFGIVPLLERSQDKGRHAMSDDRNLRGPQDRFRVLGSEPYEIAYFAHKHAITLQQARNIIAEHGPAREDCDLAAERLH